MQAQSPLGLADSFPCLERGTNRNPIETSRAVFGSASEKVDEFVCGKQMIEENEPMDDGQYHQSDVSPAKRASSVILSADVKSGEPF